jgi:hypothetical protein
MNQMREKKRNPKKPMSATTKSPMPVPASQAGSPAQLLAPAPPINQMRISTHQTMSAHVAFRQRGIVPPSRLNP